MNKCEIASIMQDISSMRDSFQESGSLWTPRSANEVARHVATLQLAGHFPVGDWVITYPQSYYFFFWGRDTLRVMLSVLFGVRLFDIILINNYFFI